MASRESDSAPEFPAVAPDLAPAHQSGAVSDELIEPPRRKKKRRKPVPWKVLHPDLEIAEILAWADEHHARTGMWPGHKSGPIFGVAQEKWGQIDGALRQGLRGLQPGSSLARLLAERRGVRNLSALSRLSEEQILAWADAHHARTGQWPKAHSGPILDAPDEMWNAVQIALQLGNRGLPGGKTLARLLAQHRGVRNVHGLALLTEEQILAWADAHHARTGRWPTGNSGPIEGAPADTWQRVNVALNQGLRGLPGGSTVRQLLARHRGVRNRKALPPLTEERILAWADAHHARTGRWPRLDSGAISDAPGETWAAIHAALSKGSRGLPGGSSLARLLARERGVRNPKGLPPLTEEQILAWADAHRARTEKWPHTGSGPVPDAPGETWPNLEAALREGHRGLPGGTTLARLLTARRGVRNHMGAPPLTEAQILAWAEAHRARTGRWPTSKAGPVQEAPGETWSALNAALQIGSRGLPGGTTLSRLSWEGHGG
jgi:hypothetical protein